MAKKGRTKKNKKAVDYNVPSFSGSSIMREKAKTNTLNKLKAQGLNRLDVDRAMSRGKLTQNASTGRYTFSTDALSRATPVGRDVPLPKSK
tara:strand:+ start:2946 stop:3218 length:273 start_codon:yes stop_codon:yes gene_type:complete